MQRLTAAVLVLALSLAGCAGNASRPGGDPCQVDTRPGQSSIVIYDVWFLPALLLYGMGCESVRALDRKGAFDSPPEGSVQDGVYTAADHTFSVTLPAPSIREQYAPQRDYVFFLPRLGGGPVYGVSITPDLEPIYAGLSIREYATSALRDSMLASRRVTGATLTLLHEEELTLDGRPALFQAYSQAKQDGGQPQAYYLVYFMKTKHRAAVLSVSWPGACPQCAAGPEQEIPAMDPALAQFVASFRLSDPDLYR